MNKSHVSDECIHCVQLPNYSVTSYCIMYFALVIKLLEQFNGYLFHIATLDLEERLILEDGPSGLIKSDLTNHPPTPVQMDCIGATTGRILSKC